MTRVRTWALAKARTWALLGLATVMTRVRARVTG